MLPSGRHVILSDTVGFIDALPPTLIKAFQVKSSPAQSTQPLPMVPAYIDMSVVGLHRNASSVSQQSGASLCQHTICCLLSYK